MSSTDMETYSMQLEQVNIALGDDNCANRQELSQLRDDLLELLSMAQNEFDEGDCANEEEIKIDSDDMSSSTSDGYSEEFVVGSKCRAPYSRFANSSVNLSYHNAIVFEVGTDYDDNAIDKDCKVMFCNPLTKSMQPCKHFLNGTCNFEDSCRFSHGESIKFDQLMDYEEPDFENVTENTLCLVKQSDDLWKLGRITAISREEESAAVCIMETNEEVHAFFSSLLPIADNDKEAGCSGDNDVGSDDNDSPDVGSKHVRHHAWRCDTLGGWEKHTRGVASKLMVKMGYVPGQGLGKEADGRVDPVEAKILPKGKSLDKCLEKPLKDPLKVIKDKKRKEKLKQRRINKKGFDEKIPSTSNVFDIINEKLNAPASGSNRTSSEVSERFSETNDKDLNIKLFRLQEKIRTEERNGERYKVGADRNEKNDKFAYAKVSSKLNESQLRLSDLKKQEKILSNEISNRKNRKKFCQF